MRKYTTDFCKLEEKNEILAKNERNIHHSFQILLIVTLPAEGRLYSVLNSTSYSLRVQQQFPAKL
jgi:hypothetical protein